MKPKIAIVTNKIEYLRFTSKILACDIIIEHENPISYLKLFNLDLKNSVIYFIGLRMPDVYLLRNLSNRCSSIIVLQHAFNQNNILKSYMYLAQNFLKYFMWSCSISASFFLRFKSKKVAEIKCYYFTDYYLKRLSNFVRPVNFFKCSEPNPTYFGSEIKININSEIIDFLYIDEPLTKTLGITLNEEERILMKLISDFQINKLFVKLHPRSNPNKFDKFKNIIITTSIFTNTKNIIGYQSNLLRYRFKSKNFIKLDRISQKWVKSKYKISEFGNYSNDVKNHLKEL